MDGKEEQKRGDCIREREGMRGRGGEREREREGERERGGGEREKIEGSGLKRVKNRKRGKISNLTFSPTPSLNPDNQIMVLVT